MMKIVNLIYTAALAVAVLMFPVLLVLILLFTGLVPTKAEAHEGQHIMLCDTSVEPHEQYNLLLFPNNRLYGTVVKDCDVDVRVVGLYSPETRTSTLTSLEGESDLCTVNVFMLTVHQSDPLTLQGGKYSNNSYYTDNVTMTFGACND